MSLHRLFLREEAHEEVMPRESISWSAEFANTIASVNDGAYVLIEGIDESVSKFGPAIWMTRVDDAGDTVLPTRGDPCLVVFDDTGQPWVVSWGIA